MKFSREENISIAVDNDGKDKDTYRVIWNGESICTCDEYSKALVVWGAISASIKYWKKED